MQVKKLVLATMVVTLMLGLELGREAIVYNRYSSRLEATYNQIKLGMTKEQAVQLLDAPDFLIKRDYEEVLYWLPGERQGWLFEKLGLNSTKGHYNLIIEFNNQGEIVNKWGGIN